MIALLKGFIYNEFMTKIKTYISQHNITVTEFAKLIGCKRNMVYKYMRGLTPTLDRIKCIEEATDRYISRDDF